MAHFWLQVLPRPAGGTTELEARQELEAAWMSARLEKSPTDTIALYNLASLALTTGKPARAVELFRQLVASTPAGVQPDPRVLTGFGSALEAAGETGEAENEFKSALAIDPGYTDAAFDLASLDVQDDRLVEAEPLLKGGLAHQPQDVEAHRLLAIVYAGERNLTGALAELRSWQTLAPTSADPHRALAQVLAQMGRLPEAIREQQAATGLVPNSASDWNDLAVLEAQSGKKLMAKRDFEHAIALDPGLEAAKVNLSKL
jgi:Flp pilus assembly protein TadD